VSDVDQADAVAADQERQVRAARAEVARLNLAVRAARGDAERCEHSATEVDARARRAEALLEQSLTGLVEDRRRERAADLARERDAAALAIERTGRAAAPASKGHPEGPSSEPPAAEEPRPGPVSWSGEVERVPAAPEVGGAPSGPSATPIPADELQRLVQEAVVSGLREALAQAAATMQLIPALAGPARPAVRPEPGLVVEVDDEEPFVRRFLYLDVLLPLVAALIVIVLALAWIG
jgi:hypothetical protein